MTNSIINYPFFQYVFQNYPNNILNFVTKLNKNKLKGSFMIKIIHFITDTNIGGAGNLLCLQIKGLDTKRFDISVALPRGSALEEKLISLPCKIIHCRYGADKSFSLENIIECYRIIKDVRPDIVHSHGSLSSRIAATVLRVPSRVFTRHCAPPVPQYMKNPLCQMAFGTINNVLSTSIIATADCARRRLIEMGCNGQKITTVINGSAPLRILSDDEKRVLRAKYGLNEGDFVISYFARLEEKKGHKTLLKAAKICKNECPNFRFFIIGTGSFEQELKRFSHAIGINNAVNFVGFQKDIAPIFNITDVNVNCSYVSETASLSLSEGMSISIPSVASNIGGNPYMVNDEENGLLFPAQDYEALAIALIRLYRDDELYKKCSLGAYARYRKELNNKIMCEKMTSFYLNEHRRTRNKKLTKNLLDTPK